MTQANSNNNSNTTTLQFSSFLKTVYRQHWAALLSVGIFLLICISLWSVLSPFFAAALISYLVSSPTRWLVRVSQGKLPYALCAFVSVLLLIVLIAGIFLLLVPVVFSQIELVQENLPVILSTSIGKVVPFLNETFSLKLSLQPELLRQDLQNMLLTNSTDVAKKMGEIFSAGSGSVLGITGFITLVLTASFFMAPVWPQLTKGLIDLVPPKVRMKWSPVRKELNQTLADYLKGIAIVVSFQSVFYAVGLSLIGLNSGWAIGILAGVLSLIPYLGLLFSLVLAVLIAILDFQEVSGVLLVIGIFLVGQLIEGFILTPMVIGERIGLPALAVIFALAFFGALFGLIGVVFALPIAACLRVLIHRQVVWYKSSRFYHELGG